MKKERRRIVRPENDTENVCFAVLSITNYILCLYCFAAYILLCVGLVVCFITGRPARSAAMPVLFLLGGPKMGFFAPQGRHVAPINVKFGTGERTPRAKFHVYRGRNVGIQPPKLSKFRILATNLPLRGHSFAQFILNSQTLYASPGGF